MRASGASLSLSSLLLLASFQLLSCFTSTSNSLHLPKRQSTLCNGSSDLCSRSYGNITFAGAHDSYAIGTTLASNQNVSITAQLNAGIRMLQAQAHNSTNATRTGAGIDLCHGSCSFYQGGAIEYWLSQIKSWSDANPTEVVTLLIVNSDGLASSQFAQAFESTGMAAKSYTPSASSLSKTQWPTMETLINSGKTIVTFMTPDADFNSVPYIIDEFSNIWENPYNQLSTPFNCSIDRIGQGVTDSSSLMYISNQFLDVALLGGSIVTPDTDALGTTNSVSGTLSTSNLCASQHGSYPNFILTDYSTVPNYDLMRAVAQMNGVSYTAPSSTSSSSGSGSGSSASGGSGSSSGSTTSGALPLSESLSSLLLLLSVGIHFVSMT